MACYLFFYFYNSVRINLGFLIPVPCRGQSVFRRVKSVSHICTLHHSFNVFCVFCHFLQRFCFLFKGDLLAFLKKRKPKDAFCIVGITMIDLYPKDSLVFGQASLTEGNI